MIRIALIVVAATCLAGCGQTAGSPSASAPPSTHHGTTATRPPGATLTSTAGVHRLTIGSYCWSVRTATGGTTACGDAAGPAAIPDLATVPAAIGETIVVRLRFTPTHPVEATIGAVRYRLPAAATLRLRVRRLGVLTVDPRRGSDDVEYLARIVRVAS
jgi:hypothetical protein